ncbi:uncharacterized protein TM35_000411020 [Trypanosoma theileri]|uniref:Uncharacterized protein n=1 Tax=Trypanosoma theileri TaxID=67003 RepID=A0A1X0NJ08_9TRYP|nr:uncharacterized protein TM35_000411020 [Trypanosoma theileri]ORC84732.1 hypothetical protein TM35_000411020 [Trypanosoma theileri]
MNSLRFILFSKTYHLLKSVTIFTKQFLTLLYLHLFFLLQDSICILCHVTWIHSIDDLFELLCRAPCATRFPEEEEVNDTYGTYLLYLVILLGPMLFAYVVQKYYNVNLN